MMKASLLAAAALLASTAALAQTPAGPQFTVSISGSTTDGNFVPTVTLSPSGQFVIAWASYDTIDFTFDPVARRFGPTGAPLAGTFAISTNTTGAQLPTSLVPDGRGGFVVSWQDGLSQYAVRGQRFDAAGRAAGAETTLVGAMRGGNALAPMPGAGFMMVWSTPKQGADNQVRGRRFDSAGRPVGAELLVSEVPGYKHSPAIAGAPDGRFVVAWNAPDGSGEGIHAQRFAASGQKQGGEFLVNTATAGEQLLHSKPSDHALTMAPDGSFVVAYGSGDSAFTRSDVLAQRFDAAGQRLGGELQVNTSTAHRSFDSTVASDRSGNFAIAWVESPEGGPPTVRARRFEAAGTPRGVEFQVGTGTVAGDITLDPLLDSDPAGNLVVTWSNHHRLTDGGDVMARRFGGLLPVALGVDQAGNGVLEPGETAAFAPSWRNVNGATQAFTGALRRFTGPAGGTYTIADGAADYGSVVSSATADCGADCYAIGVGGTRPATHWDATAVERLAPDALGQEQSWLVHVGDSFTDVPRASGFYRPIETLLHRGVTGGCGPGRYCPADSTTRGQLAVFALLAREGGAYAPPACATPLFGDVPASSPLCSWIEELARRGITGGCGGGSYCPSAAVTRDQMAVFMLRTLDPTLQPAACTTPVFGDVPAASPYCRWIEELARRGVVSGCGGGNYCPAEPVTREQMSVFLGATFGLTLYGL